jgi:hypothetical protein
MEFVCIGAINKIYKAVGTDETGFEKNYFFIKYGNRIFQSNIILNLGVGGPLFY